MVQICNMTPIAQSMGVNRIYASRSIKYPLGLPELPEEEERAGRVELLKSALKKLTEEQPLTV